MKADSRPAWPTLVLLALCGPLILFGLSRYGVVGADEAFYHGVALEMMERQDYFSLWLGPRRYFYDTFANAPLQYWARGVVASLLGDGVLGMRLLSALSAVGVVLAVNRLGRKLAGWRAGFLAALALLTHFQFLYLHSARTGELEPMVCLLLVLLCGLFIRLVEQTQRGERTNGILLLHHALLAVLFNLKAPVIPLPLIAEGAAFLVLPMARPIFLRWLGSGVAIVPVALAWHLYQAWLLRAVLFDVIDAVSLQAAGAFSSGPEAGFIGHLRYYASRALFGAFPYSLLHPIVIALALMRVPWRDALRPTACPPRAAGLHIVLLHLLAVLGFYLTISKVGPWYLVHAYPFACVLLGAQLARWSTLETGASLHLAFAVTLVFAIALAPQMADYNPFATDAFVIPMSTHWRFGSGWSALAVSSAAAALLFFVSMRTGRASSPILSRTLIVLVIGYALVRACLPLAHLDHLSPAASLHADLAERRAHGQPIPFPVEVPPTHAWIVHYYFGRDFDVRLVMPSDGAKGTAVQAFLLFEKGTWRQHDRRRGFRPGGLAR